VRQPRIGGAHGLDQRHHHLGLDPIRQVARVGNVGEAAPAVGDFLVLGENIGDQGEGPQLRLEGGGERLRRRPAYLFVPILQQIERRLDRQRFRADSKAQTGDGLVEQPVPSRIRRHRLFVE
jgi:hypothetical protein